MVDAVTVTCRQQPGQHQVRRQLEPLEGPVAVGGLVGHAEVQVARGDAGHVLVPVTGEAAGEPVLGGRVAGRVEQRDAGGKDPGARNCVPLDQVLQERASGEGIEGGDRLIEDQQLGSLGGAIVRAS